MSDGPKPLSAPQYEMRLVQKLIAAMSAPTGDGILYELDFRLRPSGNSGPLATTLRSFREHQRERAKVWEHLALTRARPIAGDRGVRDEIDAVVERVVSRERDRAATAREVREMRALMDAERGASGPFDVKLRPGGLVDLEFAAQFALLVGEVSVAKRAEGPAGVLAAMGEREMAEGYRFLSTVLQLVRVGVGGGVGSGVGVDSSDRPIPSGLLARIAQAVGEPDAERLVSRLDDTCAAMRSAFERIVA